MKNPINNLFTQIKDERRGGAASSAWVGKNKEILMMQVRNSVGSNVKVKPAFFVGEFLSVFFPTQALALAGRIALVLVIFVGVISGGGFTLAALTTNAIPGSVLYQMKLAVETAQYKLAPSADYRFQLRVQSADHRSDEITRLAEGSLNDARYVAATTALLKNDVVALNSNLDQLVASNSSYSIEAAKLLERKTSAYKDVLQKTMAILPSPYALGLSSAEDAVDVANGKAVAFIVAKYLAGDDKTSKSVVATKVSNRVADVAQKVDSASGLDSASTAAAKDKLAEAKKLLSEENYQAALSKIDEVFIITNPSAPKSDGTK